MSTILETNSAIGVVFGLLTTAAALGFAFLLAPWINHHPEGRRFGCIDGLRGYLAFIVFLHHFVLTYYYSKTGNWVKGEFAHFFSLNGPVGWGLFFMITAYLFWNRLEKYKGKLNWVELYKSRVFRLVPLYYFHLLVMVLIIVALTGGRHLSVSALRDLFYWMIFGFWGRPDIGGFPETWRIDDAVSWTLTYEWTFYFSLMLFAVLFRVKWWPALLAALGAVWVWSAIRGGDVFNTTLDSRYFVFFYAGIGVFYAQKFTPARFAGWMKSWMATLLGIACILYTYVVIPVDQISSPACWVGLTFVFYLVVMGNSFFGVLTNKGALYLGEISYSIYLLHGIVLYVLYTVLFPGLLPMLREEWHLWVLMFATGMLVVLVSATTFRFVELPFLKRRTAGS